MKREEIKDDTVQILLGMICEFIIWSAWIVIEPYFWVRDKIR